MLTLVFNAGSSSLKCELIDTKNGKTLFSSMVDRLGHKQCQFHMTVGSKKISIKPKIKTLTEAVGLTSEMLFSQKIFGKQRIEVVAHRVVHGGEKYYEPTVITPKVIGELVKLYTLAPLHNPPNVEGIRAAQKIFKGIPQVAVFDTGFYKNLPVRAYRYATPADWYTKFGVRKYGFHGISHEYVTELALRKMSGFLHLKSTRKMKIISCHLGNGCSVTASLGGQALDTSMGFTPLEGIPMGTRSGNIDPAIVAYMSKKLKVSADEIVKILNKESGLKGLSGTSSDMRDIYAGNKKGDADTLFAYDIFAYRIAMQIGAYIATLGGLDALVFTAGMGENAEYLRRDIVKYLSYLKFKTFVFHTEEGLHIAMKAATLMKKLLTEKQKVAKKK